jgi:Asp-tRNA(Asn)/Glu-tRNA(Gln) amidotransferase C subunit
MINKALFCFFLTTLIFSPSVGFGSEPVYRLGLYNLNQDPSPWVADESETVNHVLRLSKPGTDAQVDIAPEFLLDHEITDNVQAMLESRHEIWMHQFRSENGNLNVLRHEFLPDPRVSVLSVSVEFEREGRLRILKRLYSWIPVHKMILVSEASSDETAWAQFQTEFSRINDSVSVDEAYEISPCTRTFFVARHFKRLRDDQIRSKAFKDFQKTRARYKQDLLQEVGFFRDHQWGYYFLLAYLEAFNTEGVYLGKGSDLRQAQAYLDEAVAVYPNPQILNSLRLENLPELFANR